jgi:predicted nucleotidyltransferase
LAAEYGVREVRVFGSVARGEAGPDSDIDLLACLDPEVSLLRQAALVRHLQDLLGCRVDLVSERALRPRVRDRVLREAVPL